MADEQGETENELHHERSLASSEAVAAVSAATATAMSETDEERRVTALANELRILSVISPRELLLLQNTTPLESDDDISQQEEGGEEGGGQGSSGREEGRGGNAGSGRCVSGRRAGALAAIAKCNTKWREDLWMS